MTTVSSIILYVKTIMIINTHFGANFVWKAAFRDFVSDHYPKQKGTKVWSLLGV